MKFQLVAAISAVLCSVAAAAPRVDLKECEGKTLYESDGIVDLSKMLSGGYASARVLLLLSPTTTDCVSF